MTVVGRAPAKKLKTISEEGAIILTLWIKSTLLTEMRSMIGIKR